MRELLVLLLLLSLASCGKPKVDDPVTEERPVTAPTDDQTDELRGVAENAKGGAVIACDDGRVVYVDGLDAWPAEALRKRVIARGRLERTNYIPDPTVAEDASVSAGAEGLELVLFDAEWTHGD